MRLRLSCVHTDLSLVSQEGYKDVYLISQGQAFDAVFVQQADHNATQGGDVLADQHVRSQVPVHHVLQPVTCQFCHTAGENHLACDVVNGECHVWLFFKLRKSWRNHMVQQHLFNLSYITSKYNQRDVKPAVKMHVAGLKIYRCTKTF